MYVIDDYLAIMAIIEEAAAAAAASSATAAGTTAAGTAAAAAAAEAAGTAAAGTAAAGTAAAGTAAAGTAATDLAANATAAQVAGGASQAAPSGLSGLLSQYPGLTSAMQQTGLLGNVVDATGGIETATGAANNIGGGLLGNASSYASNFMDSPEKLMKAGQLLSSSSSPRPRAHVQASPIYGQGNYQLTPQAGNMPSSEQEMRRKRLMQLFQGGQ